MERRIIKPIETIYNGYRFRSRIEARWAVFFDTLGIPYEYEREGYQTEFGWYLPDFYLHPTDHTHYGYFVEIKPEMPSPEEKLKFANLVVSFPTYTEGLLLISSPSEDAPLLHVCIYKDEKDWGARWWSQYILGLFLADANAQKCARAFLAARQARFEHGEKGAPFS